MNRKKTFLSILIMIGLVIMCIILPTMWKVEHLKSSTNKSESDSEKRASVKETIESISVELDFWDFEQLGIVFSDEQIRLLKDQFPQYLILAEKTDINYIRFLPEATTYPKESQILLQFVLSDSSILPVTYSTKEGAFFFGEEEVAIDREVER